MNVVLLLTLVTVTIGVVYAAPREDTDLDTRKFLQRVFKQSPDDKDDLSSLLDEALIQDDEDDNDGDIKVLESILANVQEEDGGDNQDLESILAKSQDNEDVDAMEAQLQEVFAKKQMQTALVQWRSFFRRVGRVVRRVYRFGRRVVKHVKKYSPCLKAIG